VRHFDKRVDNGRDIRYGRRVEREAVSDPRHRQRRHAMSYMDNLEAVLKEYKQNDASEQNASIALTWLQMARLAAAMNLEPQFKNAFKNAIDFGARAEAEYTADEATHNALVDQGLA